MRDFRNLEIWERSHEVVMEVYRETKSFPAEERYGLTSQIRRAAVSVPSNIAEGCGHESIGEFKRYLHIAAGSASELQYQVILAHDLGYLDGAQYLHLAELVDEVKRMPFCVFGTHQPARIVEPADRLLLIPPPSGTIKGAVTRPCQHPHLFAVSCMLSPDT